MAFDLSAKPAIRAGFALVIGVATLATLALPAYADNSVEGSASAIPAQTLQIAEDVALVDLDETTFSATSLATVDAQISAETAATAAAVAATQAAEAKAAAARIASTRAAAGAASAAAAPNVASKGSAAPVTGGLVGIAYSKIGSSYVLGAKGPNSFDCSGFTSWVYAQAGISIPSQTDAQKRAGTVVSAADAQPGDIVWKQGHVGIYLGGNQMIDAGTPSTGVHVSNIWFTPTFLRF